MLYLHLLGTFNAQVEGEKLKLPSLPRSVPLWAYLLLNSATPLRRELLAQLLWPDEGEALGRANLRRHLHQLQLALPPAPPDLPWLLTTPTTIQWNPAADFWLDTAEFQLLARLPDHLEEAVALYQGELLVGWYDEWLFPERERLHSLFLTSLDILVEQHRARLDYPAAIRFAHQLLTHDPFNEAGLRQLLRLRFEAGDRPSALREYEQFVARLASELGIEPMAETRMLHEAILHHRPLPSADTSNILPVTAGLAMLPLVGREQELAQLERLWAEAAHDKGGLALVAGEAGIGKSRLIGELANHAERSGARVLRGGSSYAEPTPYQALVTALRPAIPLLAALDNPAPLRAVLPLLPELAHRRPNLTPLPPIDPQHEQQRLYQGLADCLVELATPRPLLLILEDLHWAGAATIELLHYLGERIGKRPLLIVGSYREEEVTRQHPLRELRRLAVQAGREHYLPLVRLDEVAVGELARQLPELGDDEDVAAQLYAESEGNPFFLSELIREWQEHGSKGEGESRLPGGVASLILARVARLAPNPRLLAEVAAVGGVGFNLELLGEVTGWDEGSLLGTLDELLDQGLMREAGGMQSYDYSFSHHLIQEAIYVQMSEEVRSRRHRRLALVTEELYPQRHEEMASELARHFDLGAAPERAVPYYLQAARQALAVYADSEALAAAVHAYELSADQRVQFEALALSEGIYHRQGKREPQFVALSQMEGIAAELDDDDLVCEVLQRKALLHDVLGEREAEATVVNALKQRAVALSGSRWQAVALLAEATLQYKRSQYDAARASATAALTLNRQLGDTPAEVECYCLLAECYVEQDQFDQAQLLLKRASELVSADNTALLIRTLGIASNAAKRQRNYPTAYETASHMLELCRDTLDREAEADAHVLLAKAASWLMQVEEAFAHFATAKSIYLALGKQQGEAQVLLSAGVLHGRLGRYDESITSFQQAESIFTQIGDVRGQVVSILSIADCCNIRGDYPATKTAAQRGLTLVKALNSPSLEANLLTDLSAAEEQLGELPASILHLEETVPLYHQSLEPGRECFALAQLALAYTRIGNLDAAQQNSSASLAMYQADAQYMEEPEFVPWTAALLSYALGDRVGSHIRLEESHTALERKLATFPDEAARAAYCSQEAVRELLAAYERDEWPAYAQPTRQGAGEAAASEMPACPSCGKSDAVVKAGRQRSGSQRYRCQRCQRYFTIQSRSRGYAPELRQQAVALHQGGAGVRAIARELGVNPQTVSNWLAAVPFAPAEES